MSRGEPFWADDEGQCHYNAMCGSPPGEPLEYSEELPEFTLDLCAEWERRILLQSSPVSMIYDENLRAITGWYVWNATKEQRVEALCRTLFPERFKE